MLQALKKKLNEQKGFTLIELLAVMVILGIIAAIAIPSVGKLINHTQDKATVAEAIQIINAAKLYASENNPADGTALTSTQLASYLENVKTTNTGYTVTVSRDSNGRYSYTISNHPAVAIINKNTTPVGTATSVSEADLIAYK